MRKAPAMGCRAVLWKCVIFVGATVPVSLSFLLLLVKALREIPICLSLVLGNTPRRALGGGLNTQQPLRLAGKGMRGPGDEGTRPPGVMSAGLACGPRGKPSQLPRLLLKRLTQLLQSAEQDGDYFSLILVSSTAGARRAHGCTDSTGLITKQTSSHPLPVTNIFLYFCCKL